MSNTLPITAGAATITADQAAYLTHPKANTFITSAPEGTWALGALLGCLVAEGDLIILTGDLGAGKTNLTKGVAAALGVAEPVTSPTFNIQAIHEGDALTLYHFDLYRLEDPEELGDAGALDVCGIEGISLVEWGEPFADVLGAERLDIRIDRGPAKADFAEPERIIHLTAHGARATQLASALDQAASALLEAIHD